MKKLIGFQLKRESHNALYAAYTAEETTIQTRSSFQKLNIPRRKTNIGLKSLSYSGPSLWNNLNENLKRSTSINNFKHKIKEFYFDEVKKTTNL